MSKKIGVVSDFHVGSDYGLSAPEYVSEAKAKVSHCLSLYEKWCEVRDWFGKLDYVFSGGDMCDGWNKREHGDARTATEDEQVKIVAGLLKTIKGNPKFYFVDGSEYHRGSRRLDELVAQTLNGVENPDYHMKAPPEFNVNVDGVCFNFAHPVAVSKSTWQYQTTPIAREQVLAILNDNPAHIVLRFHAHYFVYAGYTEHFGAVCPGFQAKTPFQGRISPLGQYRIGALQFEIDNGQFDWDRKIWKTIPTVMKA